MKKLHSYNAYLAYQAITESIDDILQSVDNTSATEIQDLVNGQEEIFQKYDLSPDEVENIKTSLEDTIRVKLGMIN